EKLSFRPKGEIFTTAGGWSIRVPSLPKARFLPSVEMTEQGSSPRRRSWNFLRTAVRIRGNDDGCLSPLKLLHPHRPHQHLVLAEAALQLAAVVAPPAVVDVGGHHFQQHQFIALQLASVVLPGARRGRA